MYSPENIYYSSIRKFRTSHHLDLNSSFDDISFIIASDIGKMESSVSIAKAIAKEEPLFIGIGGDLAYENAYEACKIYFL